MFNSDKMCHSAGNLYFAFQAFFSVTVLCCSVHIDVFIITVKIKDFVEIQKRLEILLKTESALLNETLPKGNYGR